MSCDTVQSKDCEVTDQNTSELPSDLFSLLHPYGVNKPESKPVPPEDVPELLNFTKNISDLNFNVHSMKTSREHKYELNSKLINLLKSIQNEEDDEDEESNLNYDKDELRELLKMIEGSEQQLSDKNLIEFINFVNIHNSEDLELDLSKLKNVLLTFRRDQDSASGNSNFDVGDLEHGEQNNEDIERDIENLSKSGGLPRNFGIEGSRHGLAHAKGSHIGMGLQPINYDNSLENGGHKHSTEQSGGKGHHHLGEPQHIGLDLGHLVRGPHGSLAFAPDIKVEEKLNLEPDMVKPNHEGVVISYENHPKTTTHN